MYSCHTLCLTILLASLAICQGMPKATKSKSRYVNALSSEENGAEVVERPVIQFPSIDEMTSAERETNRKMARTIANIIERNIHMVADDVLQILTLARTESGSNSLDDDPLGEDTLEPVGNDLDGRKDKDFDDIK